MDEIDTNNKGKVAFVIGWFNCVDSFSRIIQLGKGRGAYPLADMTKLSYFPFLLLGKEPIRAIDLKYDYTNAYLERTFNPIAERNGRYNCMVV